jgi:tripartite-type tricarboxylate transporter receptor subunit TctC
MGEMFKMMAGVDLVHVPYRASYFPDLLGGQVQVVFSPLTSVIEYIRDGRLRGLAVTTATRWTPLPDIPAMDEFVPGYDASGWNGIGAPKKHIHCDHRKAQQRDQRHHHRTQYEGAPFRLRR